MVFAHRCITINFDWVYQVEWSIERSLLKIVRTQFFALCAFKRAEKFLFEFMAYIGLSHCEQLDFAFPIWNSWPMLQRGWNHLWSIWHTKATMRFRKWLMRSLVKLSWIAYVWRPRMLLNPPTLTRAMKNQVD